MGGAHVVGVLGAEALGGCPLGNGHRGRCRPRPPGRGRATRVLPRHLCEGGAVGLVRGLGSSFDGIGPVAFCLSVFVLLSVLRNLCF